MVVGGTTGDNFGALPNTMFLTLTSSDTGPLLSLAMYAGINISGTVGDTYRIDYAADPSPASWTPLTNITLAVSPYLFIDVSSTNAVHRYYRAEKTL